MGTGTWGTRDHRHRVEKRQAASKEKRAEFLKHEIARLSAEKHAQQSRLLEETKALVHEEFKRIKTLPFDEQPQKPEEIINAVMSTVSSEAEPATRELIRLTVESVFDDPAYAVIDVLGLSKAGALALFLGRDSFNLKEWFDQRIAVWPKPPLTSARNVEAFAQGFGYCMAPLANIIGSEAAVQYVDIVRVFEKLYPIFFAILRDWVVKTNGLVVDDRDTDHDADVFAIFWIRSGFARVEVGHKLAANLCLTDIPDDVHIHPPFIAWSLVVPDGLIPNVARIWIYTEASSETSLLASIRMVLIDTHGTRILDVSDETRRMVGNLVCGVCLTLSNPDDFKKKTTSDAAPGTPKQNRQTGEPDFNQARFMISAPVKVDMRPHVEELLKAEREGRRASSPTVQFIVRGHWRNQAYGPHHSLRKQVWIQPFWKGPEETTILLRSHKVEP